MTQLISIECHQYVRNSFGFDFNCRSCRITEFKSAKFIHKIQTHKLQQQNKWNSKSMRTRHIAAVCSKKINKFGFKSGQWKKKWERNIACEVVSSSVHASAHNLIEDIRFCSPLYSAHANQSNTTRHIIRMVVDLNFNMRHVSLRVSFFHWLLTYFFSIHTISFIWFYLFFSVPEPASHPFNVITHMIRNIKCNNLVSINSYYRLP